MAKYSVISDVSRTIVELLQAELVPELVQQREQIGVCDPTTGEILWWESICMTFRNRGRPGARGR